MRYTFQTMLEYGHEQDHENKPYWCVAEIFEEDEREYSIYPHGKQLIGIDLDNLTREQAKAEAERRNNLLSQK